MTRGASGSETHLLCKKVAQLTKVIYLLNSKNEDQAGQVEELKQSYEEELQRLEQDAKAKRDALLG